MVEAFDSRVVEIVFEAGQEHPPLLQSDLEASFPEGVEKIEEDHRGLSIGAEG
jgi:hypothetical protein